MAEYPRLYISAATHLKVAKVAKKLKVSQKSLGDKIAKAGLLKLREDGKI